MNWLLCSIVVPMLLGIVCFLIPKRLKILCELLAVAGSFLSVVMGVWLFIQKPLEWSVSDFCILKIDSLSGFIVLAAGLFGFLIVLYSLKFMQGYKRVCSYYGNVLLTLGSTIGVLLSNHLLLLLTFWGFLGITLYLLILMGGEEAANPAKKTLIIIGGSDAFMLLGIVMIYMRVSSFELNAISLPLQDPWSYVAFFCLLIGAFAKAGAMPFHSWIPDAAGAAPIPVTAYLPAALDKLLGIYLLARMCLSLFVLTGAVHLVLMIIGTFTIIAAVMMALIQHDLRELLAYHAVSQVGYMVLGIGTGNPIGIAGGLFHMLNNTIYKTTLFLSGGAVQYRTGTTDLERLGGLGKFMPLTFASFFVAALSISGIPPFNGFVSKWMIYQGLIASGQNGSFLWIVWLVAAMFGSALTLASFMKLAHAIFLGVPSHLVQSKNVKDAGFGMAVPMVFLSLLCVLFGIFAYAIPLKHFILPAIPGVSYSGIWSPELASILILAGLVLGLIIYWLGNLKSIRKTDGFIGGETLSPDQRITGTQFYKTIRDLVGIRKIYSWAEAKIFDIYELGTLAALGLAGILRRAHTGVITMYLGWFLLGVMILFYVLMRN